MQRPSSTPRKTLRRFRIDITEHPIRAQGDANWMYEVQDRNAPKGQRIGILGTALSMEDAIERAEIAARSMRLFTSKQW